MTTTPVHFLLVEDDDAHADLIRLALDTNNVANTFDRVADGADALAYLRREGVFSGAPRPNLVLLDLKLPKVDGHEVLAAIKEDEDLRTIPVVVLTTSADEADRAKAYRSYANSYIVKPVSFDKFHRVIMDLRLYWVVCNTPVAIA